MRSAPSNSLNSTRRKLRIELSSLHLAPLLRSVRDFAVWSGMKALPNAIIYSKKTFHAFAHNSVRHYRVSSGPLGSSRRSDPESHPRGFRFSGQEALEEN